MKSITRVQISSSVLFLILSFLLLANSSFAETKTFIKEYTYQASEMDSKASCRVIALELVKRLLLEEIGTYLESHTEVKDFQLTKDHITVLTAGIVRAEILDESWDGNTLKYRLKAEIIADPDSIIKSIDRIRNDQKKTKELEDVRKKADQAMEEIERLNKDLSATHADLDKMKQYNKAVNKLSATDWFRMAQEEDNKYKPNKELIISYYEKAISLDPEYADAYFWLATLYHIDKALFLAEGYTRQSYLDKAIAAYEKAIEYNKDEKHKKSYYSCLAGAYKARGFLDKAIAALKKAILLEKDDDSLASDYRSLGYAYEKKKDFKNAITAFKKAVDLKPSGINYDALGDSYQKINDHVNSIVTFKKAAELTPSNLSYKSLARAYKANRNYDMAITALKKAVALYPDDKSAYTELGSIYDLQGKKKEAKAAYHKAYELTKSSKTEEEIFNKLSADELCNSAIKEFGKEKYNTTLVSRYLNRAIELQPDYALPHYWKGLSELDDYTHGRGPSMELKRAIELG